MRRSTSTPSPAISASKLDIDDWQKIGYDMPLLVNLQPAGEYLGEEYHRAGGVPAVVGELMKAGKIHEERAHRQRQDHGRELQVSSGAGQRRDPRL